MILPTDATSSPRLRQRRSIDIFVCMLVVSILLHCAASVIFMLPGRYSPASAPPVFLELQDLVETRAPAETLLAEEAVPDSPPPAPALSPAPSPAAEPAAEPAAATAKLEQAVAGSLRRAVQTPAAVHESAIGLGMISGHFASFAEGASLKDEIRVYYFELMRRVNEAWWTGGAAKGSFVNTASVNLLISREGKVIGCELLESSGSKEQDKALLDAVKKAGPLPPLPQSYRQQTFTAPIRFVPPLRLMLPGFAGKGQLGIKHGE